MSVTTSLEQRNTTTFLVAQLELLSASNRIDAGQVKLVYERIRYTGFTNVWPMNLALPLLENLISNGFNSDSEGQFRTGLKKLFDQIGRPIGVDFDEPDLFQFEKQVFCFTGIFEFGSRATCSAAIERVGGIHSESLTKKVDYLVIGKFSSPVWKHTAYGRKIEAAMDWNAKRAEKRILIVSENFFVGALIETQSAS